MSTSVVITSPSPSTYIDPQSSIFNEPQPDYALLDCHGQLAERYRHLPRETRAYILAEHRAGRDANALRVANCYTTGVVYEECENEDTARAHHNLCHDDGCTRCGTAKSQLHIWSATRDEEKLYHTPGQFGIELTIPKGGSYGSLNQAVPLEIHPLCQPSQQQGSNLPGEAVSGPAHASAVRPDGDDRPRSTGDARSLRAGRNRMLDSAGRFFRRLNQDGISALLVDVIDGEEDTRLRVLVMDCHKNFPALLKLWREYEPDGTMSLRRDLNGKSLFVWAFLLTELLLLRDGETRSSILLAFRDCHMIRTVGEFYSPLSDIELRKRKDERDSLRCRCNACGGKMVKIAVEERHSEPPEDINQRYKAVDWGSDRKLTAIGPIAVRLTRQTPDLRMWPSQTPSPPS
jgi:hypothetical protein